MKNILLTVTIVSALALTAGCIGRMQVHQDLRVNKDSAIEAIRIDDASIGLSQQLPDGGWTYALLERRRRGVGYDIYVVRYAEDMECRSTGYFYDTDTEQALFRLRRFDRILQISPPLYPFMNRWNETIAGCH